MRLVPLGPTDHRVPNVVAGMMRIEEMSDAAIREQALSVAETGRWLREKLTQPGTFQSDTIQRQLDDLRAGTGLTYFERMLDVFADHPQVTLDLR